MHRRYARLIPRDGRILKRQLEAFQQARQWAACQLLAGETAADTLQGVQRYYLSHLPYALQAVEAARLILSRPSKDLQLPGETDFWQTAWRSPKRTEIDLTPLPESQDESFRITGQPPVLDLVISLPQERSTWLENVAMTLLDPLPEGMGPWPLGLTWLDGEAYLSYGLVAAESDSLGVPLVKAAACALATLTPLTAVVPPAVAAPPANAEQQQRGIYYVVGQGETLKTIARDVLGDESRWQQIYELNKAKVPNPPNVRPGVSLLLPAPEAPRTPKPTQKPAVHPTVKPTERPTARPTVRPTVKPPVRQPVARPQPQAIVPETYTVRRGDSLWSIAGRVMGNPYGWTQIYQANRGKIANPNLIYPGQTLVLRGTVRATSTYTVRRGDSLWHIAQRELGNPTQWIAIYRLNQDKIRNPNVIFPGQRLRLPVR